ncbi:ABC transporter permease [Streptomyces sp. SB3404]|uniref:ABC transporter permease n=1 Tax=Streptomyces boncukensis TaxID=2711219 RepID=A0A6G4WWW5_9ACTN|nr:ABC transporter permease [Streptomyces boncukensis]
MPRVIHSEWIKLRSVRSTTLALALTVVVLIGVGLISSATMGETFAKGADVDDAPFTPTSPVGATLGGVFFAQLLTGALGVLVMSVEYSTGMIRATLSAVPTRLPVLWAKTLVFGGTLFVLTLAATLIAFFSGAALLESHQVGPTLSDPGALRAVLTTPVYLAGIGVLGIAFATLLRSTALGVSVISFMVFLLDSLAGLLPSAIASDVVKVLPASAGNAFMSAQHDPDLLGPWAGLAVFCGYLALALAAATVVLKRRDA